MRILIVEDDLSVGQLLSKMFTRAGCEVALVRRGNEAIVKLSEHVLPDAIILDVMLPDVSGSCVLDEIRGRAELRDVPVIVVSAVEPEQGRIDRNQVQEYLVKPFSPKVLFDTVMRYEPKNATV